LTTLRSIVAFALKPRIMSNENDIILPTKIYDILQLFQDYIFTLRESFNTVMFEFEIEFLMLFHNRSNFKVGLV